MRRACPSENNSIKNASAPRLIRAKKCRLRRSEHVHVHACVIIVSRRRWTRFRPRRPREFIFYACVHRRTVFFIFLAFFPPPSRVNFNYARENSKRPRDGRGGQRKRARGNYKQIRRRWKTDVLRTAETGCARAKGRTHTRAHSYTHTRIIHLPPARSPFPLLQPPPKLRARGSAYSHGCRECSPSSHPATLQPPCSLPAARPPLAILEYRCHRSSPSDSRELPDRRCSSSQFGATAAAAAGSPWYARKNGTHGPGGGAMTMCRVRDDFTRRRDVDERASEGRSLYYTAPRRRGWSTSPVAGAAGLNRVPKRAKGRRHRSARWAIVSAARARHRACPPCSFLTTSRVPLLGPIDEDFKGNVYMQHHARTEACPVSRACFGT